MAELLIEEHTAAYAAALLEYMSELLPDIDDDGLLGLLVLQKAYTIYKFVLREIQ